MNNSISTFVQAPPRGAPLPPSETSTGRRKSQHKPRGYIKHYTPQAATETLLRDVDAVLVEYRAYLPLTIRQIYYRLIGAFGYPKTDQFYGRLCHHLNLARRGRRIAFDAIRDDGISVMEDQWFEDEEDFKRYLVHLTRSYKKDLLAHQRVRIEVWCEAAGMLPQLAAVANRFSVPVFSCSGFDSTSAKYDIRERAVADRRDTVILHLGDWDPSGESLFHAVTEDVTAFVQADRFDARQSITFQRVALSEEQVVGFRLATSETKATDGRAKAWIGRYGDRTCQLEALPPDTLAALLQEAIVAYIDRQQMAADLAEETVERQRVAYLLTAGGAP